MESMGLVLEFIYRHRREKRSRELEFFSISLSSLTQPMDGGHVITIFFKFVIEVLKEILNLGRKERQLKDQTEKKGE